MNQAIQPFPSLSFICANSFSSTLIKIILGKDNDFSGEIKINPSVKIGYIPQEIKFQNESDTILELSLIHI